MTAIRILCTSLRGQRDKKLRSLPARSILSLMLIISIVTSIALATFTMLCIELTSMVALHHGPGAHTGWRRGPPSDLGDIASRLAQTPSRRPRIGLYIASDSDPPPGCVLSSIQPPFGPPLGAIWLPNSPKITPENKKIN